MPYCDSELAKVYTSDILLENKVEFKEIINLSSDIQAGLQSCFYKYVSPIQLQSIPLGLCGLDLIVQAKSGTGKTCVFCTIALEGITVANNTLEVLVLSPTREIAAQSLNVMTKIGSHIRGLKVRQFSGGRKVKQNIDDLVGCHIAMGTPGRVKQLIEQKHMSMSGITLFVLDEADKLLYGNFQADVNWIFSSLPVNKQVLALSATYPDEMARFLKRYMQHPTYVRLNPSDPALLGIRQYYVLCGDGEYVSDDARGGVMNDAMDDLRDDAISVKCTAMYNLLENVFFKQVVVFTNNKKIASGLSQCLSLKGYPSRHISGDLVQIDRELAMAAFYSNECRILVTTDLTSRGIDSSAVNLVLNLDLPPDHDTYLHRIGRAGRFGRYGAAVTFVNPHEMENLQRIEDLCNTAIECLQKPIDENLARCQGSLAGSSVSVDVRPSTFERKRGRIRRKKAKKDNARVEAIGGEEGICAELERSGQEAIDADGDGLSTEVCPIRIGLDIEGSCKEEVVFEGVSRVKVDGISVKSVGKKGDNGELLEHMQEEMINGDTKEDIKVEVRVITKEGYLANKDNILTNKDAVVTATNLEKLRSNDLTRRNNEEFNKDHCSEDFIS